jgi:hypothetical protein
MCAALATFESAVAVNPDIRYNAVRDRFYKAIGSTPYFNRRIVVQAVAFTEIVNWCQLFLPVLPAKSLKIPKKTQKAIKTVVTRLRCIPDTITTFYNGKLSIWGQTGLKLEKFLQLAHSHELGRFNCKRLRGGDIAIIYDVEVHWRSRYYKKLNRAKSAAVFTFSHCNLNRTASGACERALTTFTRPEQR